MAGLINYVKKVFKNYPDTTTPMTAENLNHLDDGIYNLDQKMGECLVASDNTKFQFTKSGSQYGYKNASGTFVPFKNPVGTKYIYSNGTYDVTNYASASVSVSTSLSETTLWTNSSPTSNFANETVTLNQSITNFTYIKIKCRYSTTNAGEVSNIWSVDEFKTTSLGNDKLKMPLGVWQSSSGAQRYRVCTYSSDTSIFISNGRAGTETADYVFIPLKISGLK